ncbi:MULTISPECIES: hypothetical protein [unclassified Mycolicibacterium]|uniref:Uncharacterized protein n=1 Tax=Mycolicibacterium sp. CBMA 213 TaxID=1968788 RepID=A0A343VRT3_9MYCO|nr:MULTISPECIES: hypothetical protein [unclassified Mycolicibacterium]AVN58607.1 hypothetical protein B5P44_p00345 [Mycolicibacterium sp. CBMA 213]MUL61244.1 hypothetical protein [Mycolicibacterium sp. CBMA 335]
MTEPVGSPVPEIFGDAGSEEKYTWADLSVRRIGLGISTEVYASTLRISNDGYVLSECGDAPVNPRDVAHMIAMELFVAEETARLVAAADFDDDETIELSVCVDQDAFNAEFPNARFHVNAAFPFTLQHVAAGRAAAELTRRGRDVHVYRGDVNVDLLVRRLAVGLMKQQAAELLGLAPQKYVRWEIGTVRKFGEKAAGAPVGLIREMQAIDDYITATAKALPAIPDDGITAVFMLDDPEDITATYPGGHTKRGAEPYPRRVHRVAVARRAGALEAAGHRVRIVVDED